MKKRIAAHRSTAALAAVLAVLCLAAVLPASRQPAVDAAPQAPAAAPTGQWRTFANGDDVLSLALQGTILWAATRGGGLVRWDTVAGTSVQFLRPQDPLGGNLVHDIAVGSDGRKWLATNGGLTVLDDKGTADRGDDVWRTYTRDSTFKGLPSDDVRAVASDGNFVWVGGIQSWDPVKEEWFGGGLGRLDTKGTPRTDDDVWAAVSSFDSTYRKSLDGSIHLGLVSDNINDIAVLPNGNLWIATSPHERLEHTADPNAPREWTLVHGGLSYLDVKKTSDMADDVWTGMSCESSQFTVKCPVWALGVDANGWVWASVGGRGSIAFVGDQGAFTDEQWRIYRPGGGLESAFVKGIAFGPRDVPTLANTVWLATSNRGLAVVDHKGTVRNQADDQWFLGRGGPFTAADGLARDRTQAIVIGGGKAWVGTGPVYGVAGGISPLDLTNLTFGAPLRTTGGPPANFITDVDFGTTGSRWAGHTWVATGSRSERLFGAGVVDVDTKGTQDPSDDVWTRYTTKSTDPDGKAPWSGLMGDNVQAVAVQGDRAWFGSTESLWNRQDSKYDDGGLTVFDGTAWTARMVDNTGGPTSGLRDGSVASLAVGCDGELWVGTGNPWDKAGAGVSVLTPGTSVHVLTQDKWAAHVFPQLASNNTTHIAADCNARKVWVSAEHHVTVPNGTSPGGTMIGGGVAVRDLKAGSWTRYDTSNGLEAYKSPSITAEAMTVAVGPNGSAYVGTYGTKDMSQGDLIDQKPYWPAVLNTWDGSKWQNQIFPTSGWVSSVARDGDGRLWVATSRGGAAWDATPPDKWRPDPSRGGLMVLDGTQWITLDMNSLGLPSNDISVVKVAPDGDIWIGTEGWGLARFQPGAAVPTPTATSDMPSPTVTNTPTEEPTWTPGPTATATRRVATPTVTRTPTPSTPVGPKKRLYCPLVQKPKK
jgi:hypothetical protein